MAAKRLRHSCVWREDSETQFDRLSQMHSDEERLEELKASASEVGSP